MAAARKREMTCRMPILCHHNRVTTTTKPSGKVVYRSNDLITALDCEGARRHEIVLNVNDDERVCVSYGETSQELQLLKSHHPYSPLW